LLEFGIVEVTLKEELLVVPHDLVSQLLGYEGYQVMVAEEYLNLAVRVGNFEGGREVELLLGLK